jgi:hypothetical protein
MDRRALHLSSAGFFVASIVLGFGILTVGFRILYDSVIPEVAALVMSGFFMAIMRPRQSWLSMLGLGIGIALSALFPVPAPADHVARYGGHYDALGFAFIAERVARLPAAVLRRVRRALATRGDGSA